MKRIAIIFLIALTGCSTMHQAKAPAGRVNHIVLCWLKDSGNARQRQQIIDASKTFRKIPSVLDVRVGETLGGGDRKIVDSSFDVAITISFADAQGLADYVVHPIHEKARDEILIPILKKVVVYDFKE